MYKEYIIAYILLYNYYISFIIFFSHKEKFVFPRIDLVRNYNELSTMNS